MAGKILIIIACSGRKRDGGIPGYRWENKNSAISRLSRQKAMSLLTCRRLLAKKYHHKEGMDLGGNREGTVPLISAIERYDGNLYREIDSALWGKLAGKECVDVLIVSALYGLLTPWEAIRKYELSMNEA